jgi:G:T/U-mismatch repair DNA glycosylase
MEAQDRYNYNVLKNKRKKLINKRGQNDTNRGTMKTKATQLLVFSNRKAGPQQLVLQHEKKAIYYLTNRSW